MHFADIRPSGRVRTAPPFPGKIAVRVGDEVAWLNPNTGAVWPHLKVEFVYRSYGLALVRGPMGRVIRGQELSQSQTVRIADLDVTKRGGGDA